MKMKFILFAISCFALQTYSQAAETNTGKASSKTTGIEPANFVTIGGDRYYISPTTVSLTALEATRLCNDDGMQLLSFDTEEKKQLIFDYLNNNGYSSGMFWLSGRKWETQWQWTGNGKLFTFTDWNVGEPNYAGSEEVCTYFSSYSGWYDNPCTILNSFICEY